MVEPVATHQSRTFQVKLQAELDRRGWGVRTLARKMGAGQTPERVESIRRQLRKYLRGASPVVPSAATRHAIEDAFGDLERDSLKPDADDEGDPPLRLVVPVTFEITGAQIDRALDRALAARASRFAAITEPAA